MTCTSFTPAWGKASAVTNATSATAAIVLPYDCDLVVLTNTSSTARTHVYVTSYPNASEVGTGTAPTTSTGYPVLPASQVRVRVGKGHKVIRTIATAADGIIFINPGNGD